VQSVLNRFVPYAKPSVQLADRIVDTALDWASKPVGLVQGTVSSVNVKVVDCKAAVVTKVSCAKGFRNTRCWLQKRRSKRLHGQLYSCEHWLGAST